MTVIASIDGPARRVYLHVDTVGASFNPMDIYVEMRALRRTDETLRNYDLFMKAAGNESKGSGKFTERYVILLQGTRIIPYDTSHELTITGTIITDAGTEGIAVFDRSTLSPTTIVDINYVPPQVEVITVSTGSGLSPAQDTLLTQLGIDVSFIKSIEGGRWIIDTALNQMVFYKDDNTTEVARFDLKNELGSAVSTGVFERLRA